MRSISSRHHSRFPSSLVSVMRIFFPALLLFWFFFFTFAKPAPSPKLRGAQNQFELPPLPLGDKSQSLVRRKEGAAAEVRRKMTPPIIVPNHAIIVAGHAVVRLNKMTTADNNDAAWYLLPYQLDQGFPSIITSHIKKGIELSNRDEQSVLLFSGGQTRRDTGPLSEAASYYYLAEEKKWMSEQMKGRVFLEEFARDSYENLLFSLCRFREVAGAYPSKVTVIGFDFKDHRFKDLHRAAIGFPQGNFTYVGMKPKSPLFLHAKATSGELIASAQFKQDMYGCSNPSLIAKRVLRNPFRRTIPYELSCPEVRDLLLWCGPGTFNPRALPWAANDTILAPMKNQIKGSMKVIK